MSLIKELQRIMDMKDPYEEARKKLLETWVIVNGIPSKILEFHGEESDKLTLRSTTGIASVELVKTLEIFLPESGVYADEKGGGILVVKLPKRQWQKSFSENFYKIRAIVKGHKVPTNYLDFVHKGPRQDIFLDGKKNIWFWENQIGKIENGKVVCLDMNFEQELKDWSRDA